MKEVHSDKYFPVSGEIVPIRSKDTITGMALSARNISNEEMQKRFFDMAVDESSTIRGSLIWKPTVSFSRKVSETVLDTMNRLLPSPVMKWIALSILMI